MREMGAEVTIDYNSQDVVEIALSETEGKGVHAVFDLEGPNLVSRSLPALKPFGRIACLLAPQGDLTLLYQKNITLFGIFLTRERKRLEEMTPLFEAGRAHALIEMVLPLEEVSKAHERLDSRHGHGKIVLKVSE